MPSTRSTMRLNFAALRYDRPKVDPPDTIYFLTTAIPNDDDWSVLGPFENREKTLPSLFDKVVSINPSALPELEELVALSKGDFAHYNFRTGDGHEATICLEKQQNADVKAILPGPITVGPGGERPRDRADISTIGGAFTTREGAINAGNRQLEGLTQGRTGVKRGQVEAIHGALMMFAAQGNIGWTVQVFQPSGATANPSRTFHSTGQATTLISLPQAIKDAVRFISAGARLYFSPKRGTDTITVMAFPGKTLANCPRMTSGVQIIGSAVASLSVPVGQSYPNHVTTSNIQVFRIKLESIYATMVEQADDIQMRFDQWKRDIDYRRRFLNGGGPMYDPQNRPQRPMNREPNNKPQPELPLEELDFLRLSPTGAFGSFCDIQSLEAQVLKRKTVPQPPLRDPADMKEQMMKDSPHGIDFQRFSPIAHAHCDISNFLPPRMYRPDGPDFGSPGWKKQQEMRVFVSAEKETNEKNKAAEKIEGEDEDEVSNGKEISNKDIDASTEEKRKQRMRKRAQQLGMENLGEWKAKK
ncbi:MAG: hypothetical protein Q9157_008203 [Trypethelium eluteriae]